MKLCSCCMVHEAINQYGNIDMLCRYCSSAMNWESNTDIAIEKKDLFESLFKQCYCYMDIRKIIVQENEKWQEWKKVVDEMYDKLQELA